MSFSYQQGQNPPVDFPRGLTGDTVEFNPNGSRAYIFSDQEITMFTNIAQSVWQSSMFWSAFQGVGTLPSSPVSYLRIASLMMDALASNKSRLASVIALLDVKLSPKDAAIQCRTQAQEYRDVDDNTGAFVIIEQCNNYWSFRDRFWNQWQRTAAQ